jgi:hypothetical protein
MKSVLGLELQLEHIDYSKKNFVHADLSPEKMAEAMRERGEDPITLALGVVADMLRKANLEEQKRAKEKEKAPATGKAAEDVDFLSLMLDPSGGTKLKALLAEQFEAEGDGGLGPTLSNLLVADRNKACLKVLNKELAKGRKKVAIFYGAAHMPDFEARLKDEFDLKKDREEWLTAWDLKKKGVSVPPLLKLLGGDQ